MTVGLSELLEAASLESTQAGQADPLVGRTVSHFRILERLHTVGIGVAYKAEDTTSKRTVGLKLLPRAMAGDEGRRQKVVRDMRALGGVLHPHLVHVIEAGVDDSVPFIAFELIEGTSLGALIAKKPLPVDEAARLAFEVVRGLARAHDVGVHHRGLSVDSVLVGRDGDAKVIDFGVAKPPAPTEAQDDVVAWGKLAWLLLAGELPARKRRPLVDARPGVPPQLAEMVERCLDADDARRPANTRDVAAALGDVPRDRDAPSQRPLVDREPAPLLSPRARKAAIAGAAALVVLIAAGATIALWPETVVAPSVASVPEVDGVPEEGWRAAVAAFYDADDAAARAALTDAKGDEDAVRALASAVGARARDPALATSFAARADAGWFGRAIALAHVDVDDAPDRALREAEALIRSDPAPALPHVAKSAALLRLGRPDDAATAARAVLQAQPDHASANLRLAEALLADGDAAGARAAASTTVKRRPSERAAWDALLSSLVAAKDDAGRRTALENAKRSGMGAADVARVLLRHGVELSARGRADDGAALVDEATQKAEAAGDRRLAAEALRVGLLLDRLHQADGREGERLTAASTFAQSLPEDDATRARLTAHVLAHSAHRALAAGDAARAEEAQRRMDELPAKALGADGARAVATTRAGVLAAQGKVDAATTEIESAYGAEPRGLARYERPWWRGFAAGVAHQDDGIAKAAETLAAMGDACLVERAPDVAPCRLYVAQAVVLAAEIAYARGAPGRVAELAGDLDQLLPEADDGLPLLRRFKEIGRRVQQDPDATPAKKKKKRAPPRKKRR